MNIEELINKLNRMINNGSIKSTSVVVLHISSYDGQAGIEHNKKIEIEPEQIRTDFDSLIIEIDEEV